MDVVGARKIACGAGVGGRPQPAGEPPLVADGPVSARRCVGLNHSGSGMGSHSIRDAKDRQASWLPVPAGAPARLGLQLAKLISQFVPGFPSVCSLRMPLVRGARAVGWPRRRNVDGRRVLPGHRVRRLRNSAGSAVRREGDPRRWRESLQDRLCHSGRPSRRRV